MDILHNDPDFLMQHDAARRCLSLTWRGGHTPSRVRACCALVLKQVQRTKVCKILSDSSQDLNGWGELTKWLRTDFRRQLAAAGIVAVAWVLARDVRARSHIHQVADDISHPLVDTFGDVESAVSWLKNVHSVPAGQAGGCPAPSPG